ncbi:MAG TPA: hypothetical protein VFA04_20795 [Bryobacteraceae bacterium]|nr:hypothetical protein [Bryobacteraceae bacterium]
MFDVVPVHQMRGEDDAETKLLKDMCIEAKQYLESFHWCQSAAPRYWGGGVGKVFAIFLFEVDGRTPDIDQWLWVIVGDIPRLYLVVDQCKSPAQAFRVYMELMEAWVALARQGKTSRKLPPVGVEPTPEWADALAGRLQIIRETIAPFINGMDDSATR